MDKKILHDIGNYLHQIISYSERVIGSSDCLDASEYAAKIKKSAYSIDAIVSDFTATKENVAMSKETLSNLDFERFVGLKVLIVDDIVENIEIMRNIFKSFSFEIISATSAQEALAIYKSGFSPDIVCIDIIMPGMDGAQATKELKGLGSTAFFIAVSALKNQPSSVTSVFDYWLPKPFTTEQIVEPLLIFESKKHSPSTQENPAFKLELDEETKKQLLAHAQNGAYSSLSNLVKTFGETPSKQFLLRALNKMDLDAIVNSIVSP